MSLTKELTAGDPVSFKGRKYAFVSEYIGMAVIKNMNGELRDVRTDKLTRIK